MHTVKQARHDLWNDLCYTRQDIYSCKHVKLQLRHCCCFVFDWLHSKLTHWHLLCLQLNSLLTALSIFVCPGFVGHLWAETQSDNRSSETNANHWPV